MTTLRAVSGPLTPEPGPLTPEPSVLNPLPPAEQTRRTWLVVLVIMSAFILIGIVTWVALTGSAGKSMNASITNASIEPQSKQAKADRNAAREVRPAKAFTFGRYKMLAGWKVEQDTSLGDALFSVTGKVRNLSNHTSTPSIRFTFVDKSGETLGSVQCNSADLKPGQTQAVSCIPDGKYGKYETVAAKAIS